MHIRNILCATVAISHLAIVADGANPFKAMQQEMERMQQLQNEMFEQFEKLHSSMFDTSNTLKSVEDYVSFDTQDGVVQMHIKLPRDAKLDLQKGVEADVGAQSAHIYVTYDGGEIIAEVQPDRAQVTMEQAYSKTKHRDGDADEDEQEAQWFTRSTSVMRNFFTLPYRVDPSSLKQEGNYRITYDDAAHMLTLTFDQYKRTEPVTVQVRKQADHAPASERDKQA